MRVQILSLATDYASITEPAEIIDKRIPEEDTMSESKIYPAPAEFIAQANVTAEQYEEMYRQSVEDPDGFWSEQAENYISWFKPWNSVSDWSFAEDDLHIKWFEGAELNVSYNCIDRT